MTIRHTSRCVVAPTCRPIAKVVQSSDRKRQPVSLPQAGGSEVVILWIVIHDRVLAQSMAMPIDNNFPGAGVPAPVLAESAEL